MSIVSNITDKDFVEAKREIHRELGKRMIACVAETRKEIAASIYGIKESLDEAVKSTSSSDEHADRQHHTAGHGEARVNSYKKGHKLHGQHHVSVHYKNDQAGKTYVAHSEKDRDHIVNNFKKGKDKDKLHEGFEDSIVLEDFDASQELSEALAILEKSSLAEDKAQDIKDAKEQIQAHKEQIAQIKQSETDPKRRADRIAKQNLSIQKITKHINDLNRGS